jgi:ribulose-phosphate 3-epimerase
MDGHFVPNISFGPVIVEAARRSTKLPLDAHLMIENPEFYINSFHQAGADIITLHAECYGAPPAKQTFPRQIENIDIQKLNRDIQLIKSFDINTALAINPGTPLCFNELLTQLDMVLIMSVNPGFSGQKFMESVLPKIEALRKIYKGDIGIDGGINDLTAKLAVRAGANILVTASHFFSSANKKKLIDDFKLLRQ